MGLWQDITGVTAAQKAADAMREGTELSIAEQRRQFDAAQELASPYVEAGAGALQGQQALSGALGPEAQQQAIAGIQAGPGYTSGLQAGETSILQNASATGGVRGGNTQGLLAQFAPGLLNQQINQQYGRLGGISGMGQNSAMGLGQMGMQSGQNIGAALSNQGNAEAGNILGQYNLQKGFVGDMFGGALGLGGLAVDIAGLF